MRIKRQETSSQVLAKPVGRKFKHTLAIAIEVPHVSVAGHNFEAFHALQ